jgi:hypothetical protein
MAGPLIGASLAPALLGLGAEFLLPRPSFPSLPAQQALPDRSAFSQQLLESAFSPQSDLLNLATQTAQGNLGRQLGRRGLTGGSFAQQAQSSLAAELANKFLEGELARRQGALQTVTGVEQGAANIQNQLAQQAFQNQMSEFGVDAARRGNIIRGLTGIGGAVGGAFQQQASQQNIAAQRAADRDLFREIFRGTP